MVNDEEGGRYEAMTTSDSVGQIAMIVIVSTTTHSKKKTLSINNF